MTTGDVLTGRRREERKPRPRPVPSPAEQAAFTARLARWLADVASNPRQPGVR